MKSKTPRAGELSVSATAGRRRTEVQRKDADFREQHGGEGDFGEKVKKPQISEKHT